MKVYIQSSSSGVNDMSVDDCWELVKDPDTGLSTLKKLVRSTSEDIRRRALDHPNMTDDVVIDIARKCRYSDALSIATMYHPPLEALKILSNHYDASVRGEVAVRDDIDDDIIRRLAKDPNYSVRLGIAINYNTPPDVLAELALHDENPQVRAAAASGSRLTGDVMMEIATSDDLASKQGLLRNTDITEDAARYMMMNDSDDYIRKWSTARLRQMGV